MHQPMLESSGSFGFTPIRHHSLAASLACLDPPAFINADGSARGFPHAIIDMHSIRKGGIMKVKDLGTLLLALWLVFFGLVQFGLDLKYNDLILGVVAIAAGVLLLLRR
jgi:hypothetical protein